MFKASVSSPLNQDTDEQNPCETACAFLNDKRHPLSDSDL